MRLLARCGVLMGPRIGFPFLDSWRSVGESSACGTPMPLRDFQKEKYMGPTYSLIPKDCDRPIRMATTAEEPRRWPISSGGGGGEPPSPKLSLKFSVKLPQVFWPQCNRVFNDQCKSNWIAKLFAGTYPWQ